MVSNASYDLLDATCAHKTKTHNSKDDNPQDLTIDAVARLAADNLRGKKLGTDIHWLKFSRGSFWYKSKVLLLHDKMLIS